MHRSNENTSKPKISGFKNTFSATETGEQRCQPDEEGAAGVEKGGTRNVNVGCHRYPRYLYFDT